MPTVKTTELEQWRRNVRASIVGHMERNGYDIKKVSEALGMHPITFKSKLDDPDKFYFGEIRRLAKIFRCDIDELLGGDASAEVLKLAKALRILINGERSNIA